MSLLSDFLPKPYLGLSLAAGTLTFATQQPTLLLSDTGAVPGNDYPQLVLRNGYQAVGSGAEIRFQCRNSTPIDVVAVKAKGTFTTLTAGAEVGQLELLVYRAAAGGYEGLVVAGGAVKPHADAGITLGTSAARFGIAYFGAAGGLYPATFTPADVTSLAFGGSGYRIDSTGKTYNLAVSTYGAAVFNNQLPSDALLAIGYTGSSSFYSQAPGATGYGVKLDYGIPSTQTTAAVGINVKLTTQAATFTCTNVYGIKIDGWTAGSGATTGNAHGIYVGSIGIGHNLSYGLRLAGSYSYAIYALGAGQALFNTASFTDDVDVPYQPAIVNIETISTTLASQPALSVQSTQAGYAPTNGLVWLLGAAASTAYLLKVSESGTGTVALTVQANGTTVVGNSGQLSSAKLSVGGRVASNGNDSYDLAGNTLAVDSIIVSTHSVGASKSAQMIRLEGTMSLSAFGGQGYGLASIQTASAHVAGSMLHGIYTKVSTGDAGTATGVTIEATATAGHTGLIRGIAIATTSQAGSASTGIHVQHAGSLGYGLFIEASSAGSALIYGCYVGQASAVTTAAYAYQQRSGSTADALLYRESGGTDRFRITSAGDIIAGGTTRRFKADMDSTGAARFAFQTTGSATTTLVAAIPSSGGSQAGFMAHDAADMDNAARVLLYVNNTAAILQSSQTGTGVTRAIQFNIVSTTVVQLHTNTDVVLGPGSMTTGSTAGFPYIPTCAGAPTGAATSRSGFSPAIVDETNNRVYFRVGSTWRYAALT